MKTSELRLGNWVRHNSEFCYRGEEVHEFQWDESDWYALGECTMFIENIEPIPITEEWLLKFGFEKISENKFGSFIDNTGIPDYEITFFEEDGIHFFIAAYMSIPPSVELEHIHQLQNLYFALNGEELQIK